jgi:hypothetical protein
MRGTHRFAQRPSKLSFIITGGTLAQQISTGSTAGGGEVETARPGLGPGTDGPSRPKTDFR